MSPGRGECDGAGAARVENTAHRTHMLPQEGTAPARVQRRDQSDLFKEKKPTGRSES